MTVTPSQPAIQVQNLFHTFSGPKVIDDISYEVQRGEVFGLLGPNGAGKTTSVRLLNGLYTPTSGQITILGLNPAQNGKEVRSRCGVLTETPAIYERLSAVENLEFFGTLAGLPSKQLKERIAELLAFFELEKRARERVGTYSKGMKQRLALARALLARPELLFLDEPTSGLDPEAAAQVRELIHSIRSQDGSTVFLCTHHLDEAERLCDRVAIMNKGRFLAVGSLAELTARYQPALWVTIALFQPLSVSLNWQAIPGALAVESSQKEIRVQVKNDAAIPAFVTALVQAGAQILRVEPEHVSLEDIYFKLQNNSSEWKAQ